MLASQSNLKNHYPYFYFGKTISCSDVEQNGSMIKLFNGRLYINYGNGLCIKRLKHAEQVVNDVVELEIIPIANIFKQIKWVMNSNNEKIYGRKHSKDYLVKMEMRRKDRKH